MIEALAAFAAAGELSSPDILSILVTWGPGGVILVLVLTGVLEPKKISSIISADRDSWKEAFVKEQEAHQKTRDALAKAEERAEASLAAAQTTADLLEELGHRRNKARGT